MFGGAVGIDGSDGTVVVVLLLLLLLLLLVRSLVFNLKKRISKVHLLHVTKYSKGSSASFLQV